MPKVIVLGQEGVPALTLLLGEPAVRGAQRQSLSPESSRSALMDDLLCPHTTCTFCSVNEGEIKELNLTKI